MSEPRLPLALRVAQIACALPDFPGRDTLLQLLASRSRRLDAVVSGTFAGGLRFEGNPATDGNILDFFLLRYSRPALSLILDAALSPGAVFADVGANLGMYTLFAARLVGASGIVHAFEPVPDTYARLRRNVSLNGFTQVQAHRSAVGSEEGTLTLYKSADASGIASRYRPVGSETVEVPVTTLDAHFDGQRPPDLVKIDVEGMEFEVLRGARRLLRSSEPPIIVFESEAAHMASGRTSFGEILAFLSREGGYRAWSLLPSGLQEVEAGASAPGSLNTLAARPDSIRAQVIASLRRLRFEKNQNA